MIDDYNELREASNERTVQRIMNMQKTRYNYVCSKCDSINHKIDIRGNFSIKLSCDTLTKREKYDIIYEKVGINFDCLKLRCDKCNEVTTHYAIDDDISGIITALHEKGYKTEYSCEGHYNYSYIPSYFTITGDVVDKFDLDNPLISDWKIEFDTKFGPRTVLRIDSNKITMADFIRHVHLNKMLCYIEDYL